MKTNYYFLCNNTNASKPILIAILTYLHELGYVGDGASTETPLNSTSNEVLEEMLRFEHMLLLPSRGIFQCYARKESIPVNCETIAWRNVFTHPNIKPIVKSIEVLLDSDLPAIVTRDFLIIGDPEEPGSIKINSLKIPKLMAAYQKLNG